MNALKLVSYMLSAPVASAYFVIAFSLASESPLMNACLGLLFIPAIPLTIIFYYSRKGAIDLEIFDYKQRPFYYFSAITSYAAGSAVFWALSDKTMFCISAAYVFVTASVMLVNFFWKISAHAAGITGPVTALIYVFGWNASLLYMLIFPITWIRLKLKAHTLIQLIAGAIIAVIVTCVTYEVFWVRFI